MKKRFDNPKSAERAYCHRIFEVGTQTSFSSSNSVATQTEIQCTCTVALQTTASNHTADLKSMSTMFSQHCNDSLELAVPIDFLELSISAMKRLKQNQRSNVVYNFVKGVGTERPDKTDSKFPVLRMPMGLVEYVTNFFVAEDSNQVSTCRNFMRTYLIF